MKEHPNNSGDESSSDYRDDPEEEWPEEDDSDSDFDETRSRKRQRKSIASFRGEDDIAKKKKVVEIGVPTFLRRFTDAERAVIRQVDQGIDEIKRVVMNVGPDYFNKWTLEDDQILSETVPSYGNFRKVVNDERFNKKFTERECQERWFALLYHPQIGRNHQARAKYLTMPPKKYFITSDETRLIESKLGIRGMKDSDWQVFIEENRAFLHPMRELRTIVDYSERAISHGVIDSRKSATERRKMENDSLLLKDVLIPPASAAKKQEISRIHNERPTPYEVPPEMGDEWLYCLRGLKMDSFVSLPESLLGREVGESRVDVNLSQEGIDNSISRRQAWIRLNTADGRFLIENVGKNSIFVDGIPLSKGSTTELQPKSQIKIGQLCLMFYSNEERVAETVFERGGVYTV